MKIIMMFIVCVISVAAQCATVKELKGLISDKEKEITEVRKGNPACLINPNSSKTIRNREIKMIDRAQAKYYCNKNVIFVRERFWCTKCKSEFDVGAGHERCPAAKASFPLWRDAYNNIQKTKEINQHLDGLFEELDNIKKQLTETEKREREQKKKELEEKRKAKQSKTGK